jgi:hypothetical protein
MTKEDAFRNHVREIVRQALTDLQIESPAEASPSPSAYYAPWTGVEYESHPSRSQFDINEASSTVGIAGRTDAIGDLIEFVESKLCTIEKNRSCDHCGMCRSLGF